MVLREIEIIRRLIIASGYKDAWTFAHIARVGKYASAITGMMGGDATQCASISFAAQAHDVGKIGVPDGILCKQGPLTAEEFNLMRQHTVIGADIIGESENDTIQLARGIALYHHECFDGSGYPHGLAGEKIPLAARITMVCDVYDALRSVRPYKAALSHMEAVETILAGDGRTMPGQFDPELLLIFKRHHEKFRIIFDGSLMLPVGTGIPSLTTLANTTNSHVTVRAKYAHTEARGDGRECCESACGY